VPARAIVDRVARVVGAGCSIGGLAGWAGWLSWRVATLQVSMLAVIVLALEIVAFAASLVVSAGLLAAHSGWRARRRAGEPVRPLPVLLAEGLDLADIFDTELARTDVDSSIDRSRTATDHHTTHHHTTHHREIDDRPTDDGETDRVRIAARHRKIGDDDTGEIAWARRGISVLGAQRRLDHRAKLDARNLREAAWSIVALDGLRRLGSVVVLMAVLFTGTSPFPVPTPTRAAMLIGGIGLVSIGHWLTSGGHLRPGSRLIWSMASIGAGLGDGVARTGMPIRWVTTMATLVILNLTVALRGMSDRWTHGLGPMEYEARIISMTLAAVFVAVGGIALARMPRPELAMYGATRRLEETSVRRLALGLTLAVAIIGFVAGVLPGDTVVAAP
jgi:hypothetical protein